MTKYKGLKMLLHKINMYSKLICITEEREIYLLVGCKHFLRYSLIKKHTIKYKRKETSNILNNALILASI